MAIHNAGEYVCVGVVHACVTHSTSVYAYNYVTHVLLHAATAVSVNDYGDQN